GDAPVRIDELTSVRRTRSVEHRRADDGHRAARVSGTCAADAREVRRSGRAHRLAQGVAFRGVVVEWSLIVSRSSCLALGKGTQRFQKHLAKVSGLLGADAVDVVKIV